MYEDYSDNTLLDALDHERKKYPANETVMREMVVTLIARGVYPSETVEANPNDVWTMVSGWGARWHEWRPSFTCPHCKADLRDHRLGPPFKREIGRYSRGRDETTGFTCPDCKENLTASLSLDSGPN
jgi:predicted RNA-binding Zn-ribbon protein involved in translation (DUF1610 family)